MPALEHACRQAVQLDDHGCYSVGNTKLKFSGRLKVGLPCTVSQKPPVLSRDAGVLSLLLP